MLRTFFSLLLLPAVLACGTTDDDDGTTTPRDGGQNMNDAGNNNSDGGTNNVQCDENFGQADACGGDFEGAWTYESACGPTGVGTVLRGQCPTVNIGAERIIGGRGSLSISGSAFTLDVTTDVHVEAAVPLTCIPIGGCAGAQTAIETALPNATVVCTMNGTNCDCVIDGPVQTTSTGNVVDSGNGVATVDGTDTYYFCVVGNQMSYRRFGTGAEETTFVLQK